MQCLVRSVFRDLGLLCMFVAFARNIMLIQSDATSLFARLTAALENISGTQKSYTARQGDTRTHEFGHNLPY